jgi:hypothetical protein
MRKLSAIAPLSLRTRPPPCCRTLAAGGVPSGYSDFVPAKHVSIMAPMMPDAGQVFDYTFSKQGQKWALWTDSIAPLSISEGSQFSDIIVPTKDMQRWVLPKVSIHSLCHCS